MRLLGLIWEYVGMKSEEMTGVGSVPPASVGLPRKDRPDHQEAIPVDEYLERSIALGRAFPVTQVEDVPLLDALGRCLAQDVVSAVPVPAFTNSAMDGYAVQRTQDVTVPIEFSVVGEQPAGPSKDLVVGEGEAVRIMTGAPLPKGANTVVRSEYCAEADGVMTMHEEERLGANIRMEGEDQEAGSTIVTAGTCLGARDLSAIASVGQATVRVRRRPRVAVISTGSELVAPGEALRPGMIYESNSTLMAALLVEDGYDAEVFSAVADTVEGLATTLSEAASWADAALMSGGASFGKYDVVRELLGPLPEALFTRVLMQPGKPQGLGVWEDGERPLPFLSFPGNPVSVFVSYRVFGLPFLAALAGGRHSPLVLQARAGEDWKSPSGRTQFLPGRLENAEPGELPEVYPVSPLGSGSHLVTSMPKANALAVGPEEVNRVHAGDVLSVQVF